MILEFMKKVCIVTAARSEYGLLRWIIDEVHRSDDLELQLVVTGGHLSPEQGLTYKFIEEDGYPIAEKVEMLVSSVDEVGIAKSMGLCSISIADTFKRLSPDILVVLGDRYEQLSIVGTALVMGIPIAHISGGDVTEGAIDDEIRNALSMMSTLHFPGVEASADNLRRMRGTDKNIFAVGEPGLDSFLGMDLWTKQQLADDLRLNLNKHWCLVTLHSETKLPIEENLSMAKALFDSMLECNDCQFVITKANADLGGTSINNFWKEAICYDEDKFRLIPSLGQIRYLSFMREVDAVLGNSSSGIVEAPFMGTPVVNIGERQNGRYICKNVICCGRSKHEISKAIHKAMIAPRLIDKYWGDGHTSERIVKHIRDFLYK